MRFKGEIWLVNLNPIKKNNEMGKIRAVVVFQNNELNQNDYPTTIIIPLSTALIDDAEPITKKERSSKKIQTLLSLKLELLITIGSLKNYLMKLLHNY
ncbi:MAG: type II toxin-antitoxin system PemK/MazF family toxin, partial [Campylobacterota bacterium]|nr:type II toxin-antitoxin system PemK/MazF family toxin [Campylobacterota bacterium]